MLDGDPKIENSNNTDAHYHAIKQDMKDHHEIKKRCGMENILSSPVDSKNESDPVINARKLPKKRKFDPSELSEHYDSAHNYTESTMIDENKIMTNYSPILPSSSREKKYLEVKHCQVIFFICIQAESADDLNM